MHVPQSIYLPPKFLKHIPIGVNSHILCNLTILMTILSLLNQGGS